MKPQIFHSSCVTAQLSLQTSTQLNSGEKKGGGAAARVAVGEGLPARLNQREVGRAQAQRERIVMEIKKFVFKKGSTNPALQEAPKWHPPKMTFQHCLNERFPAEKF